MPKNRKNLPDLSCIFSKMVDVDVAKVNFKLKAVYSKVDCICPVTVTVH